MAYIAVGKDATRQVQTAAHDLAHYIKLSTGVRLAVHSPPLPSSGQIMTMIVVETSRKSLASPPGPLGSADGFSISFPNPGTVLISGSTDWGTEFGVYEFLERYVGIRWLMPGPQGEYVPKLDSLSLPIVKVRQEPAFFSRLLSGLKGSEQTVWARRNRMHSQIAFHHNLYNLLPPVKYTKTHSEFFPVINGKRYLPPDTVQSKWQPCFSAQGIAEEAVENICAYFAAHPTATSYSLGINDSGGQCECETCRAKSGTAKNFLGLRNMSDVYYEWANSVVARVLKKYPDKWFGCLAYSEVAQPPSRLTLNPRLVPFMTYERMKWYDPQVEQQGYAATEGWQQKSSNLGWYDYIYGSPYLVPRVYFHKMAEYYRYGQEHGVRFLYSEAYPNWGEGPKLFVALKLQWDPSLNVDALLKEWYEKSVGKEAAPYLEAYFQLWEDFWRSKVPKLKWFKTSNQYLSFYDPGYLEAITDEITKSRQLLETVVAKTTTAEQLWRAKVIFREFEYYEASVISYQGHRKFGRTLPVAPGQDAELFREMSKKRLELINDFEKNPVLIQPVRFDRFKELIW